MFIAPTDAPVDIIYSDNTSFSDAFQFLDPDNTGWTLSNKTFDMWIKTSKLATSHLVTLSTGSGQIVMDDAVQRIIHFAANAATMAPLTPGEYVYDLRMTDTITGVVTLLMSGEFHVVHGITGE